MIRGVSRKPCQTSKMAYFAKKVDGFFSGQEGGGGYKKGTLAKNGLNVSYFCGSLIFPFKKLKIYCAFDITDMFYFFY